ncbi:MAG: rhomboid family intramembrane serine protease [Treponema sp.]|nr:rhomboid family intramembrane serine protease [Treponema sp.]
MNVNNIIRRQFRYADLKLVYWLIGINLVVFLLTRVLGQEARYRMTLYLSMVPAAVLQGWVWSFITYMFMHADFGHVFFNMFGLFIFGIQIEKQMGSKEFLLYYLLTGALSGVFSFFVYYLTGNLVVFLMGASGALYAVQIAFAIYNPTAVIYIWGVLPLRAPVMVLAFTVLSLFFVVTGGGGNVAHLTHLAGFGFGWLYFMVRFGVNPWKRLTGRY